MNERDLVSYLFSSLGCAHPFRISRILLMAEWLSLERRGHRLTEFTYVKEKFGFYIGEIKELIDKLEEDGCIEKVEEEKCFRYKCQPPELPDEVRSILDEVIGETKDLSDQELNRLVIKDPRYEEEP